MASTDYLGWTKMGNFSLKQRVPENYLVYTWALFQSEEPSWHAIQ